MSLIFRSGQPGDIPACAQLGAHSFPGLGATLAEWEGLLTDSPHGGTETLWVGEDDDRIVAFCRLLAFRQWVGGTAIPIMGLSTVAISPSERRRGIGKLLTSSALRESRRRGDLATALYPFRDSFYRSLGYGMAGEVQQFLLPPSALPDHPARRRVTLATLPADRPLLAGVYNQWASTQTGQLQRTERAWERVWEGDSRHGAVYRNDLGEPGGYVIFSYPGKAERGRRALEVEEIAWLDREARLGLYGWLSSLSDQWDFLLYRAHPEEAFPEHLSTLRGNLEGVPRWHFWFPASTTLYGPMFRLLDVEGAWSARPVHPGPPMSVALEVDDAEIAENSGEWVLRLADGRTTVTRGGGSSVDLRMKIGIEPLSRLFIGAIAPSTAVLAGLATSDRPDMLSRFDSLVCVPKPWTFDRF